MRESPTTPEVMSRVEGWPRVTRREPQAELTLLPLQMPNALLWALRLPVGSIIRSGGTIVLDEPRTVLNEQFVLA